MRVLGFSNDSHNWLNLKKNQILIKQKEVKLPDKLNRTIQTHKNKYSKSTTLLLNGTIFA